MSDWAQREYDGARDAAERGDWEAMLAHARRSPESWDVWQTLPSSAKGPDGQGPGLPDEVVHKILNHLQARPSRAEELLPGFLFEYSSNLPEHAGAEILNRVADLGKEDHYVTENVHEHKNWKPDPRTERLMGAAKFWHSYEQKVEPHHFAVVKSLYTQQPEKTRWHRGEEVGDSSDMMHLLPHLPEHAKLVQDAVLKDWREFPWQDESHSENQLDTSGGSWRTLPPRVRIKHFNGESHVQVFRGLNGDYADRIADTAGLVKTSFGYRVPRRVITVPVSHLGSWTIDRDVAKRFATTRAQLPDQAKQAIVLEKWLPLKHLLHSGFHTVSTNQDHAHQDEYELVFGHPNGVVKIPTKNIHVVRHRPDLGPDHHELVQPQVIEPPPKPKKPKAAPEVELGKSEPMELGPQHLEKMAISAIKPGKRAAKMDPKYSSMGAMRAYDYSHVLPPQHRAAGYRLIVTSGTFSPDRSGKTQLIKAAILKNGVSGGSSGMPGEAGHVTGMVEPGRYGSEVAPGVHLKVGNAEIWHEPSKGQGLGTSLYEALFAHAKHRMGATHASSDEPHSTSARGVHQALSRKHGMAYDAEPNPLSRVVEPVGPYDAKWGPYSYTIKHEADPNLGNRADVLHAQLGNNLRWEAAVKAAKFLAPSAAPTEGELETALWEEDGNVERAALRAHGMEATERNLRALRAVRSLSKLSKAEVRAPKSVRAAQPEGQATAEAVQRAFAAGAVEGLELEGKHSAGSMLAKDRETGASWLLKPGAGGSSPIFGVAEETASQSAREAAWWHAADALQMGEWYPRADLLLLDGRQVAAVRMLPPSFKTLDDLRQDDPTAARRLLEPWLKRGMLHRWAALSYVFGDGDQNAGNVMAQDPPEDELPIQLIDHGSAFAGPDFTPGHDRSAFVPFCLRGLAAPEHFNLLSPEEKLRVLPRLDDGSAKSLGAWLLELDFARAAESARRYGVHPGASEERLQQLQAAVRSGAPADLSVLQVWVGLPIKAAA